MPKKTTILILILTLVTVTLVTLAIRNESQKRADEVNVEPKIAVKEDQKVKPYADLKFEADTMVFGDPKIDEGSTSIILDTNGKPVSSAQIELLYDPKMITDISVVNPENSFFGSDSAVLINQVDQDQGRVTYAVSTSRNEIVGTGPIARLNFTLNRDATDESSIIFLPKTTVTSIDSPISVLNNFKSLKITLSE